MSSLTLQGLAWPRFPVHSGCLVLGRLQGSLGSTVRRHSWALNKGTEPSTLMSSTTVALEGPLAGHLDTRVPESGRSWPAGSGSEELCVDVAGGSLKTQSRLQLLPPHKHLYIGTHTNTHACMLICALLHPTPSYPHSCMHIYTPNALTLVCPLLGPVSLGIKVWGWEPWYKGHGVSSHMVNTDPTGQGFPPGLSTSPAWSFGGCVWR